MSDVRWTKSALEELATAWVEADSTSREAISAAAAKIDELLAASPQEFGESREGNRRIGFVPPLGVAFSVDTKGHVAKVLHVWTI